MNPTSDSQMSKRPISGSAVARIVIWSAVLLILCAFFAAGVLGTVMNGRGSFFGIFSFGGYSYEDADSYTIGGGTSTSHVKDVEIDWLSGDIEILPTDGDTITIQEDYTGTDEDTRLRWKIEDGELSVKFCKPYRFFGGSKDCPSKKLTLLIPKTMLDAMGDVEIDSVDSHVTFMGRAEELSVDAVSGKLTVNGHADELNIDSVEMDVDYTGTVRYVDLDGVEIKAVMHVTSALNFDIGGVDNDVTLYFSDDITGFSVDHASVSSSVTINGYENVTIRDKKDRYWGDGSITIDMHGVDVQLKIEKETND